MNKKMKGFTFVELLMVMLILGFIATLTIPLIKNLMNKQDIYRGYQKKGISEITNAYSLIQLRTRNLTGNNCVFNNTNNQTCANFINSNTNLRDLFAMVINGTNINRQNWGTNNQLNNLPGLEINKKAVLLFNRENITLNLNGNNFNFANVPVIYYDADGYEMKNGNLTQNPASYCKDRYKFLIINDRVILDSDTCSACTNMSIQNN